jgi:DNA-binding response OmpR family regulator
VLPERAQLKIGDVALWFLAGLRDEPEVAPPVETASAGGLVRFLVKTGAGELCVVGSAESGSGGSLLSRATAATSWQERGLATLEFQLLRTLCQRAVAETDSPATVRGCVPTKQLARDLPFQSRYANEENVRQVVRRLRQELAAVGADGVLAVAPGRGYYLACTVSIG